MSAIRTILCPIDFSDSSRYAFRLARSLAQVQEARLVLLHVSQTLGPMVAYGQALAGLQPPEFREKLRLCLHGFEVADPNLRVEYRLAEGDAAEEILRASAEIGSDLIVMGSRGRSDLERMLLGSVAERVLRKASCPVVTVKLPRASITAIRVPAATATPREAALADSH